MKKLIFILFLQSLYAQSLVQFDLGKSFISYDGKHPAHNWTGVSKDIQGTFEMNKQDLTKSRLICMFQFLVLTVKMLIVIQIC